MSTKSSTLGFHEGSTLIRVAATYPTLLEVLLEAVQNSIDKGSHTVDIVVSQKSRVIAIRDDGDGVSQEEFERALSSVGRTIKKADSLGRFGLGLVSPVGKCEKYFFASTPKTSDREYREWLFETEEIRDQRKVVIPFKLRPDLCFGEGRKNRSTTFIPWRTEVRIEKYSADKFISRISMDTLCDGIFTKYNPAMRRKGTVVKITIVSEQGHRESREIHPRDYEGIRLPENNIEDKDGGITTFRIFLSKKTTKGRQGKISVGEACNDFRIGFPMFVRSLPEGAKLADETIEALQSGIFEGEILTGKAKFAANRRGFEANDALLGFCVAIDKWYQTIGTNHFKEAREQREEERYQDLGRRSLQVIKAIISDPAGSDLLRVIEMFRIGTRGIEHFPVDGKTAQYTAVSTEGAVNPTIEKSGKPSDRTEPEKENVRHHPLVVIGPKGQRRILVRDSSLGIILSHEVLADTNAPYQFDTKTGMLRLNTRHPIWVQCDETSDKVLMRYQEFLMLQALMCETLPEDWREQTRIALCEFNGPYALMLMKGDFASGRIQNMAKARQAKSLYAKERKSKSLAHGRKKTN